MRTYIILAFLSLSCIFDVNGLTTNELTSLDNALRTVVRGPAVATTVRLAFHDCVGGCNGCLNVDNPDNAGLEDLVGNLETAYTDNSLSALVSRADFWAYAGIYAVKEAIASTNAGCDSEDCTVSDIDLTFQTGRVDCATAPYTDADVQLPGPHLTYAELTSFYYSRFGMTAEEAVAIMGAHTLGAASQDNSGFRGAWIAGGAADFNNEYYTALLNNAWTQRDVSATRDNSAWQWNARDVGFMLNSDMCLLKEIVVDGNGESSCNYATCANSAGADYVQAFADSQDTWLQVFARAFTKMQAAGDFTLVDLVEEATTTTTARPARPGRPGRPGRG